MFESKTEHNRLFHLVNTQSRNFLSSICVIKHFWQLRSSYLYRWLTIKQHFSNKFKTIRFFVTSIKKQKQFAQHTTTVIEISFPFAIWLNGWKSFQLVRWIPFMANCRACETFVCTFSSNEFGKCVQVFSHSIHPHREYIQNVNSCCYDNACVWNMCTKYTLFSVCFVLTNGNRKWALFATVNTWSLKKCRNRPRQVTICDDINREHLAIIKSICAIHMSHIRR